MSQKRVAAIHDISGFGKCSLTVALPIISAAGVETSVIPTAVLSTHTGGFTGFTYRDLTKDLLDFAQHWSSLDLHFDAIYSGFLGSFEQIDIVSKIFDMLKSQDTLVVVDPCMADNGELYKIYSEEMVGGMAKLCSKADLIVPNITEACMILGEKYKVGPYSKDYIETILRKLGNIGCNKVVLTGVFFDEDNLGAACYDKVNNTVDYALAPRIDGYYHGTGDVFASALVAGIMRELDTKSAMQIAVNFTQASILRTKNAGTDIRFGVNFEEELPSLIKNINGNI